MDKDNVRLGKINKNVQRCFNLNLDGNDVVYVLIEIANELANNYPNDYLAKLEEAKKILKYPLFGAYSKDERRLYLMKEYIKGNRFIKAGISIDITPQCHLENFFVYNGTNNGLDWILISPKKSLSWS